MGFHTGKYEEIKKVKLHAKEMCPLYIYILFDH